MSTFTSLRRIIPMIAAAVLSLVLAVPATCFLPSQQRLRSALASPHSRTGWTSTATATATATYMADTSNDTANNDTANNDTAAAAAAAAAIKKDPVKKYRTPTQVPTTWDEMVRGAATAMKQAAAAGQKRQIVRLLLPRDANANDFGKAVEQSVSTMSMSMSMDAAVLVPPDESWQGGIMQLYRAAAPTCEAILRQYSSAVAAGVGAGVVKDGGLPPRVTEDRSVDESGVDGVGLWCTDAVTCWLQPTQENVEAICERTVTVNEHDMVVVMNPQWRMVDDALDTASKGEPGFFSAMASFLGGKGGALRELADTGFAPVYSLEGYVCRGSNVRLLQVLDSDWAVFCERDDGESYVSVGSQASRPNYQEVEAMLNDSDIGFKYARDMGLSKKL